MLTGKDLNDLIASMFEKPEKKSSKLNLTPLIDIIFQLVIFFMLSTTFIKTEAMDVFVAEKEQVSVYEKAGKINRIQDPELFRIEVLSSGRIKLNGDFIEIGDLKELTIARLNHKPWQKVDVLTHEKTTVQELVDVLDIVRFADATNVSINSIKDQKE